MSYSDKLWNARFKAECCPPPQRVRLAVEASEASEIGEAADKELAKLRKQLAAANERNANPAATIKPPDHLKALQAASARRTFELAERIIEAANEYIEAESLDSVAPHEDTIAFHRMQRANERLVELLEQWEQA